MVIGVDIGIDMRRVKARMDATVAASRNGLTSALENAANITLYRGHARFASPQAVEIAGERLRARQIFINVGGRALVPPMPGINEVPYLTNSSMMEVDFLPRHLIIVGGSYIGLEFGQMYRRFGSEVTIIEMAPRLVALSRPTRHDLPSGQGELGDAPRLAHRPPAGCIMAVLAGHALPRGPLLPGLHAPAGAARHIEASRAAAVGLHLQCLAPADLYREPRRRRAEEVDVLA